MWITFAAHALPRRVRGSSRSTATTLKWHAYAMATTGNANAHGVAPRLVSTATTSAAGIQSFFANSDTRAPETKSRTKKAAVAAPKESMPEESTATATTIGDQHGVVSVEARPACGSRPLAGKQKTKKK